MCKNLLFGFILLHLNVIRSNSIAEDRNGYDVTSDLFEESDLQKRFQQHKIKLTQLQVDDERNQTFLQGLVVRELTTENQLKQELSKLQLRKRWKRCPSCDRRFARSKPKRIARPSQPSSYLPNKVAYLQRTVGKLAVELKKTQKKVKTLEKWILESEGRFASLESIVERLQQNHNTRAPESSKDGMLTGMEANFLKFADETTRSTLVTRSTHRRRTASSRRVSPPSVSIDGVVYSYMDIVEMTAKMNNSFPTYRKILYNLYRKAGVFQRYAVRRHQSFERRIEKATNSSKELKNEVQQNLKNLTSTAEDLELSIKLLENGAIKQRRDTNQVLAKAKALIQTGNTKLNRSFSATYRSVEEKMNRNNQKILTLSNMIQKDEETRLAIYSNVSVLFSSLELLRSMSQNRTEENEKHLTEVYNSLHSFESSTASELLTIKNFVVDLQTDFINLNQRVNRSDVSKMLPDLKQKLTNLRKEVAACRSNITSVDEVIVSLDVKNQVLNSSIKRTNKEEYEELNSFKESARERNSVLSIQNELGQFNPHRLQEALINLQKKIDGEKIEQIEGNVSTSATSKRIADIEERFMRLNESFEKNKEDLARKYLTVREYDERCSVMKYSIQEKLGEYKEKIVDLENRLLTVANSTGLVINELKKNRNSSQFVNEETTAISVQTMRSLKEDIDYNYNTTKLIIDYIKEQDERLTDLTRQVQKVLSLEAFFDSLETDVLHINNTLTSDVHEVQSVIKDFMDAFDTSNRMLEGVVENFEYAKKNMTNHLYQTSTNLDYLTKIVQETIAAVDENRGRAELINGTMFQILLSLRTPVEGDGELWDDFYQQGTDYDNTVEESFPSDLEYAIQDNPDYDSNGDSLLVKAFGRSRNSNREDLDGRRFARGVKVMNNRVSQVIKVVQSLQHSVDTIGSNIHSRAAFSVGLTRTFDCCGTVTFDKVFSNPGDLYDTRTGKFTSKVAGIYAFFVTISERNRLVNAALVHNGISRITIRMDHSMGDYEQSQSSNMVLLPIEVGDQVWLQTNSGSLKGYQSPSATFSGFLVAG